MPRRTDRNQLAMFMTPRQIRRNYSLLEGDREERWVQRGNVEIDRPETNREFWARKGEEARMDPSEYAETRGEHRHFDIDKVLERSSAPQAPSTASTSAWEHHDWEQHAYLERKADEWHMEPSIHESVRSEGVQHPVWLATGQFSKTTGKPEILGGHHRIAAAYETAPDRYIPVTHAENIWTARMKVNKRVSPNNPGHL